MLPAEYPDNSSYYFISYSRKDCYFAEALAYGLTKRGVNVWIDSINLKAGGHWEQQLDAAVEQSSGIILVGSRSAYESANVQKELALGRSLNKPLYIAKSKWHRIPKSLDYATVIRFAPSFDRGVITMSHQLQSPRIHNATSRDSFHWVQALFPMEWDVMCFAILFGFSWMGLPILALNILSKMTIGVEDFRLLTTIFFNLFLFFRPWAKRTMGWTRLNVLLLFAFVGSLLSILLGFVSIPLTGIGESVFSGANQNPVLWIIAFYIAWLLYLMYGKKSDQILRWLPTGSAPEFLRTSAYGVGSAPPAGMSPKFSDLHSYFIHSDSTETALAERLKRILDSKGGVTAEHSSVAESHYIILTGNTRVDFVENAMLGCTGNLYPVISTGVRLNRQLGWLWQLQWIDFRKWVIKEPIKGFSLPVVPEALTSISLPKPISICYFAAIMCLSLSTALGTGFMGYSYLLFGLTVWMAGISLGYLLLTRLIKGRLFVVLVRLSVVPFILLADLYFTQGLAGYRLVCFCLFCATYAVFFFSAKNASSYLPSAVRISGVLRGSLVNLRPLRDYFLLVFALQFPAFFG